MRSHLIRVTTGFMRPSLATPQQLLQEALNSADAAARDQADVLCLPELFSTFGKPDSKGYQRGESVPGPTTRALSRKAKQHRLYIICPLLQKSEGRLFNAAVLIDRQGRIAGIYHKHVPTTGELEHGVSPGAEVPAFQTDFGRIGISICFDVNYDDVTNQLARQQVKMIFWPSMFEGGFLLEDMARRCDAYVVSSTYGESARILDLTGRTLATATYLNPLVTADVNLQRATYLLDTNADKLLRLKRKYGSAVTVEYLKPEQRVVLGSNKPGLTLAALDREFQLEPRTAFLARARSLRDQAFGSRNQEHSK